MFEVFKRNNYPLNWPVERNNLRNTRGPSSFSFSFGTSSFFVLPSCFLSNWTTCCFVSASHEDSPDIICLTLLLPSQHGSDSPVSQLSHRTHTDTDTHTHNLQFIVASFLCTWYTFEVKWKQTASWYWSFLQKNRWMFEWEDVINDLVSDIFFFFFALFSPSSGGIQLNHQDKSWQWCSANQGYVATLLFIFRLLQCSAYDLVMVTVSKRSSFSLKYLFWSPQSRLEMSRILLLMIKNAEMQCRSPAPSDINSFLGNTNTHILSFGWLHNNENILNVLLYYITPIGMPKSYTLDLLMR